MKIKRFFAPDSRKALRMVQEALGEDAIIISNRRVDDGVEILAAEDFDDELAKLGELDTATASFGGSVTPETPRQKPAPKPEAAQPNNYSPEAALLHSAADGAKQANTATKAFVESQAEIIVDPAPEKLEKKTIPDTTAEVPVTQAAKREQVMTQDAILQSLVKKKSPAKSPSLSTHPENNDTALISNMRAEISKLKHMMENQFSALHLGNWSATNPTRSNLVKHLTRMGFSPTLATQLVGELRNVEALSPQQATREVLALLTQEIKTTGDQIFTRGGTIVLIGPAGAGKTTSIAKIAGQYTRLHGHKQVILVSADNQRIGAHEQLVAFGRLFNIPVLRARDAQELKQILNAMADKALVLVDTGSLSQEDLRDPQRLPTVAAAVPGVAHYLVLPAPNQIATLDRVAAISDSINIAGTIISKTDEAANLGAALTATLSHDLPVGYWSDSHKVTQSLHVASPKHLVAKAVTMINKQNEQAVTQVSGFRQQRDPQKSSKMQ